MTKFKLVFIAVFLLTSCGGAPSEVEQIAKYTTTPDAFEKLAKFIEKDAHDTNKQTEFKGCFDVGTDHIAEFWFNSVGNSWSSNREYKLSLPEVLAKTGISYKRFGEYLVLFKNTGSERVTYCEIANKSPVVHALVFRSGTIMGGSMAEICKRKDNSIPENQKSSCCSTINTKIRNGWYLSVSSES